MTQRERTPRCPKYLRHKGRNLAYTYLRDAKTGRRRAVYLGPWNSPESHREFRRIVSQYFATGTAPTKRGSASSNAGPGGPTVAELCAAFLLWAEKRYRRKDGTPTGEAMNYQLAVRPLLKLYRDLPTEAFDVTCLRLVRDEMESQRRKDETTSKLARTQINRRINRIRFVFRKGAVEFGLAPTSVWNDLRALEPLQVGQTDTRETEEVLPVPDEAVDAVLPFLAPPLAAMVEVGRLTGARPDELCTMRPMDIHRSNTPWIYRPRRHKNEWRKQKRIIPLGPRVREILTPFLLRPEDAPLFSPIEAEAWRARRKAEGRNAHPSTNKTRDEERRRNPKRIIGNAYCTSTYRRAIHRACDAAKIPRWSPNRLRHSGLTRIERAGGREAAKVVGGHKDRRSTDRYVEDNVDLAEEVVERIG